MINPSMSFAGVESTMLSPAETSHYLLTQEDRIAQGITDNLIRFSVGIEDVLTFNMILNKHLTIVNKSIMKVDILAIGAHPMMLSWVFRNNCKRNLKREKGRYIGFDQGRARGLEVALKLEKRSK
ncbi:MAG: hypothetical protein CM15mP36_13090 [Flavobacteriales bacterium]|nr:MAG: hypothetical protein CM15mP36_13090 [Flavobacteriales bacterium]